MSAAMVWAMALVVIVAIITFGVYMVARQSSDLLVRIKDQERDLRAQAAVIQDKQATINKRDVEINQLKIDLQTEKNRIHLKDVEP